MGEVIGQYELQGVLGGGGMATVYRGSHTAGIGMAAAIKMLHPHLAVDPGLRKRLQLEAQALARLKHANIVQLLDFVICPAVQSEAKGAGKTCCVDSRTLTTLVKGSSA